MDRHHLLPALSLSLSLTLTLSIVQLSFDLIESWLERHPDAAGLRRDGALVFRELALFQDYHGLPAFKKVSCTRLKLLLHRFLFRMSMLTLLREHVQALADFMGELRGDKVKFEPHKLVLTAGSTSANETLMFCLAEPGEAFLLPTPYYPGYISVTITHCSSTLST